MFLAISVSHLKYLFFLLAEFLYNTGTVVFKMRSLRQNKLSLGIISRFLTEDEVSKQSLCKK